MGTVLVDYYDAECVRCGWKHRVMYGGGLGTQIGHTLAVARHANATLGRCTAYPDEIREQPKVGPMTESTFDRVLFATGKDDWETPPDLFLALDVEFGFQVDVAANATNHKTPFWFGPDSQRSADGSDDALAIDWSKWTSGPCWCNPPYSRGLQGKFIAKAAKEAQSGNNILDGGAM